MGATIDLGADHGVAPLGKVVTRFAPSPTGFLHLGGARTALFNLLFARHHGGRFLLRIEDTDRARSTQPAIDAILAGMRWLGLDWDGDAVFQFERAGRHAEVAGQLVAAGHAYRCWMSADEIAAQRQAAQAANRPLRIRSPWRDRTDGPADQPHVVRLRAPQEGAATIADLVQGEVTVQNAELDDLVLLRSNGTPTYMLAVVVDDHDMGVTHVIRGDDHLNNAFRQLPIIRAMGWPEPNYAHIPLIHGSDGAKLSKRHGAVGIEAYRDEMGILPEAMDNYLLRLGWGHGDAEIIPRDEAIAWFDLAGVGKSPSRFDLKKLENLNGHYIREADDIALTNKTVGRLESKLGRALQPLDAGRIGTLMPDLKMRAKSLNDLAAAAEFVTRDKPIPLTPAADEILKQGRDLLTHARDGLAAAAWDLPVLEDTVRQIADRLQVKLGALAQPLRAALTGDRFSPGIFEVMVALGRDETLGRLDDALAARNRVSAI